MTEALTVGSRTDAAPAWTQQTTVDSSGPKQVPSRGVHEEHYHQFVFAGSAEVAIDVADSGTAVFVVAAAVPADVAAIVVVVAVVAAAVVVAVAVAHRLCM